MKFLNMMISQMFEELFRYWRITSYVRAFWVCIVLVFIPIAGFAEGTKQLEPTGKPANSYCKLSVTRYSKDGRIPFALAGCSAEYRLNIHIKDWTQEKIYLGFGNIIDYQDNAYIFTDMNFRLKDPAGNIVPGFQMRPLPKTINDLGFISSYPMAISGPDINNSNPGGYKPFVLNPTSNGDYILEFDIPGVNDTSIRIIKYFDVTVAKGNSPVEGRLWSKVWQLSSGNVDPTILSTYSKFYIYSSDSIVSKFDCNGLAGGVWTIYSNEWGCSTSGPWTERRRSIPGNASLQPQHKIFLNNPDEQAFPSGHIGEMIDFKVLPFECDTLITFMAHVTKGGNIEVVIDAPPYNATSVGPEDIQLGYNVVAGQNTLIPSWNGKNSLGVPMANGTIINARIRFLNGLSNIPLFDVEANPKGFKVDIERPLPASGLTKLKIFWDDLKLPSSLSPTANASNGCEYSGIEPYSGCHAWNNFLGNLNTVNSWWYHITNEDLAIPITLQLRPSKGKISGPKSTCTGQEVVFRTSKIPYVEIYVWQISGPGVSVTFEIKAPDTSFSFQFNDTFLSGEYLVSVSGKNPLCGEGDKVFFPVYVFSNIPPKVIGEISSCTNTIYQYQIPGSYTNIQWIIKNGEIVGPLNSNPVSIRWHTAGNDTIFVSSTTPGCGSRNSKLYVKIHPSAVVKFEVNNEATTCPGNALAFTDKSELESGSINSRLWNWGNSTTHSGNDSLILYTYSNIGNYNVTLKVSTDKGCLSEFMKQIRVIPYPEASFSCYSNCIDHHVIFYDNSTGVDISSWKWDFGAAPASTGNLYSEKPDAVFRQTGIYPVKLNISNKYGCSDSVTKLITIHNVPKADFINELACQQTDVLFTDQSKSADAPLELFSWITLKKGIQESFFNGNPATVRFNDADEYLVYHIVTDNYGCTDTVSSLISVKPKPDCSFNYNDNIETAKGSIYFINNTLGATNYFWDFGNGVTSTLFNPEIIYEDEGEYIIQLIATSLEGCSDTSVVKYSYMPGLWLPNAFTPNNDNENDMFRPVTKRTKLDPYQLLIFNQWGQIMFNSRNIDEAWDGTFQGNPCPIGNYTYFIEYKDVGKDNNNIVKQRGVVKLIR